MMKTSLRTGLIAVALAVLSACTVADLEPPQSADEVFEKPKPDYPNTEYVEGHEGWVLLGVATSRAGLVMDVGVLDSSGSDAFNDAALVASQEWRFAPGEQRMQKVLVNYVFEDVNVFVSRRYMSFHERIHDLVDEGELDAAEELLVELRAEPDLDVVELAYSYLAEGRVAGERGDTGRQLALFRKAALNDGRWLARDNYLATLRAIVIMDIDVKDYASAVRDYELLTETSTGRKLGADLKDVIQRIDAALQEYGQDLHPYMVADHTMTVEHPTPEILSGQFDRWGNERRTPTVRPSPPPPTQPPPRRN